MNLPVHALSFMLEPRQTPERRRGRPRRLPAFIVDWAEREIASGRSRLELARELGVHRTTLGRRVADRRAPEVRLRCHCGAVSTLADLQHRDGHCSNGHMVNAEAPRLAGIFALGHR